MAEDNFKNSPLKLMWQVKTGRLIKPQKPFDGFWTAQGHNQIQRDGRVEDVVTRQPISTISLPIRGVSVIDIQISKDGHFVVVRRNDNTVLIQNPRWF